MHLEIPLAEVQQLLRNKLKIDVDLKNMGEHKIEATYIDSVVITIVEVKEDVVLFHYEVDGLASILTKIAHFFLEKKMDKKDILWDTKKKELKIDLNKITELNAFLEVVSISEIHFIKNTIVLEMYLKGKAKNLIN